MARIALIDDDVDIVDVMRTMLELEGWQVLTNDDGDPLIPWVKRVRPDLLITDLHLDQPEEGLDLLTQIRLHPHLSGLPVIVCSADRRGLERGGMRLAEHGALVLHKPFEIEDLYNAVERALSEPLNGGTQPA